MQDGQVYCNRGGWPGGKLYCNTLYCIAEKEAWRVEFGLQYTGVYCNRGGWPGGKLYCNTLYCIAEKEACRVEFGLQYTGVYCNRRRLEGLNEAKIVSQYNRVYCDNKGLLGEPRYKICIATEAAGLAGR